MRCKKCKVHTNIPVEHFMSHCCDLALRIWHSHTDFKIDKLVLYRCCHSPLCMFYYLHITSGYSRLFRVLLLLLLFRAMVFMRIRLWLKKHGTVNAYNNLIIRLALSRSRDLTRLEHGIESNFGVNLKVFPSNVAILCEDVQLHAKISNNVAHWRDSLISYQLLSVI